jgi:hypothetical protein
MMRGENDPPVSANHFSFRRYHRESNSALIPPSLRQLSAQEGLA